MWVITRADETKSVCFVIHRCDTVTGYLILSLNWEGSWKAPVGTQGEFPRNQSKLNNSMVSRGEVQTHKRKLFFSSSN